MSTASHLPAHLHIQIATAIHQVRQQVHWRPGKDQKHLTKRIKLGHLLPNTTVTDYNTIIQTIVKDNEALVYVFQFGNIYYPTVVTMYQKRIWLAMFGMDGIMETSFPPDKPEDYFKAPSYQLVGKLEDILS